MDIFDTSGLRSVSKLDLEILACKRKIVVASVSIWELLCHLDEPQQGRSGQESYESAKGQILKARNLEVLPDPFAFQSQKIGGVTMIHPDRYLDPHAVDWLFLALEASPTLQDLYSQSVNFTRNQVISFEGCALGARESLSDQEAKFVATWKDLVGEIKKQGITDWKEQVNSEEMFWKTISNTTDGIAQSLRQLGNTRPDLEEELFHVAFCYNGYILAKLIGKLRMQDIGKFSVDKNDTEDALICGYVDVRADDILVTNDKQTIKALSAAFDAYNTHYAGKKQVASRVVTTAQYKHLFLADSSI